MKLPKTLFKFLKDEKVWTGVFHEFKSEPVSLKEAIDWAYNMGGSVYIKIDNPEELLNEEERQRK